MFFREPVRKFSADIQRVALRKLRQLMESPEARVRQREGQIKLVGAICEIDSGRVRLLDR